MSRATIEEQFDKWISANPEVYASFVDLALQAKAAGRRRVGAKMLAEVLRWQRYITTTGANWKIPNSYTSRLARKAMVEHPSLRGLFVTAKLRTP